MGFFSSIKDVLEDTIFPGVRQVGDFFDDNFSKVVPGEIKKYIPSEIVNNPTTTALAALAAIYGAPYIASQFGTAAPIVGAGGVGGGAAGGATAAEILSAATAAPAAAAAAAPLTTAAGATEAAGGLFGLGDVASAAIITGGLGAASGIASGRVTAKEGALNRKEARDRFDFEKAQAAFNQKLALDQFKLAQQKMMLDAQQSGSANNGQEVAAIAALLNAVNQGAAQKQGAVQALIQGAGRLV